MRWRKREKEVKPQGNGLIVKVLQDILEKRKIM